NASCLRRSIASSSKARQQISAAEVDVKVIRHIQFMNLKPRPCKVRKNGAADLSFFWRTCNACRRTRRNFSVGNLGVRRAEESSPQVWSGAATATDGGKLLNGNWARNQGRLQRSASRAVCARRSTTTLTGWAEAANVR